MVELSRSKAIRLKCLDCCGGSCADVRRCSVTGCPLFPYRFGNTIHALNSEAAVNSTKPCYLYFISDGEKVKIGISEDVKRRIENLQSANHKRLTVLETRCFRNRYYAKKKEKQLHEQYKDFCVGGEWFDILNTRGEIKCRKLN